MSYYIYEVIFMLTHEELMAKCQELWVAGGAIMAIINADGYTYDSNLMAHKTLKSQLIERKKSLLSIYLKNRGSISDEDAEEIISVIRMAEAVNVLITGLDETHSSEERFHNIYREYFM